MDIQISLKSEFYDPEVLDTYHFTVDGQELVARLAISKKSSNRELFSEILSPDQLEAQIHLLTDHLYVWQDHNGSRSQNVKFTLEQIKEVSRYIANFLQQKKLSENVRSLKTQTHTIEHELSCLQESQTLIQ